MEQEEFEENEEEEEEPDLQKPRGRFLHALDQEIRDYFDELDRTSKLCLKCPCRAFQSRSRLQ
eukprot:11843244-Karenia_brevis.AAC.1